MRLARIAYGIKLLLSIQISCALLSASSYGAVLYKNYLVRQDMGRDILCEVYTVRKDDWIYKLFREMGEISQEDFPEFLRIFKRLNPQVNNLDIIRPGENIIIPLKKVKKNALPGQDSGIVSLPLVNISNISDLLKSHSNRHEVQKGDFVSNLVARA